MGRPRKNSEITTWREKHFAELEKSLQAAIAIRDDPDVDAKVRVAAIHEINRMLGVAPPKHPPAEKAGKANEPLAPKPDLSEEEKAKLDELIGLL
jgi:hypothetical protein